MSIIIKAPEHADTYKVMTPDACNFLQYLHKKFNKKRLSLLAKRKIRQSHYDKGNLPYFLPETEAIRLGNWKIASLPADLQDRRVEITGPTSPKMVINALNSGAKCFMADFEDSNCPTWANMMEGQVSMMGAVRRNLAYQDPKTGKNYTLNDKIAVLLVRPRGWHLDEAHVLVNGVRMSGAIFDFALYFFHNIHENLARGTSCYYYLPKMESHLEAELWNEIFVAAQSYMKIPLGTIKATVLIETLPAAFEMEEILYQLRDHSAGLNCGRWDYMFNFIKKFANQPDKIFPDRGQVTMTVPNMRAYCLLEIQTCHKRGAPAIGGMAAQIPIKDNPQANETAMAKVRADKEREVKDGHDGTWVAHPGMVTLATEIFDKYMPKSNQINKLLPDFNVSIAELVQVPDGSVTDSGLRGNIDVGVRYLEAWLGGNGCVPIHNLMEDAATAEISRAQLWQWIRHEVKTAEGNKITPQYIIDLIRNQRKIYQQELGDGYKSTNFDKAIDLFQNMSLSEKCPDFLTLDAYESILQNNW